MTKSTGSRAIAAYLKTNRTGSLDLFGCTGLTALPEGLIVGGSLDLSGCTGLAHLSVGKDARGYKWFGVRLTSGQRVIAGCRNFSPAEARKHWANRPEQLALAEKAIAISEARA